MTENKQAPIVEYRVKMSDGWWSVPAHIIADNRATYYEEKDGEDSSYRNEYDFAIHDEDQLRDWARNNMDWSDVVAHATKCADVPDPIDYEEGWGNGETCVILGSIPDPEDDHG